MTLKPLCSVIKEFIKLVVTTLPPDVLRTLREVCGKTHGVSRLVCSTLVSNAEHASRNGIPLCQDTGFLIFFIDVGLNSPYLNVLNNVKECIYGSIKELTFEGILRPNSVNPLTNVNPGDNTGRFTPWFEWGFHEGDDLRITLYVSGGGSTLPAKAVVMPRLEALKALPDIIVDSILRYGVNACPPLIIGIGLGPTIEIASLLSKKALLRPLGVRSDDPRIAVLEEGLMKALNELNVGVQGFGGTTVMDVHIEYAYTHPAVLAIAVSFSCWALRRGTLILRRDGSVSTEPYGVEL